METFVSSHSSNITFRATCWIILCKFLPLELRTRPQQGPMKYMFFLVFQQAAFWIANKNRPVHIQSRSEYTMRSREWRKWNANEIRQRRHVRHQTGGVPGQSGKIGVRAILLNFRHNYYIYPISLRLAPHPCWFDFIFSFISCLNCTFTIASLGSEPV